MIFGTLPFVTHRRCVQQHYYNNYYYRIIIVRTYTRRSVTRVSHILFCESRRDIPSGRPRKRLVTAATSTINQTHYNERVHVNARELAETGRTRKTYTFYVDELSRKGAQA